jgi:hypothetical protein
MCVELDAEVRAWGEVCETCELGRPLDVIGVARNTCFGDAVFVTDRDCLVEEWAIVDLATGDVAAYRNLCGDDLTRWTVPGDDRIEGLYTWGTLPVGDYRLRVTFGDGSVRRTGFSVR